MAWQHAASLNSIRDGGVIGVNIDGTPVALYNLRGEIFATHGICTHALALLSEGWVEDGKIECPLHQGQFDIRTGKALCAPLTQDLRTYAVKLEGDNVFVDLDRHGERPVAPPDKADRSTQIDDAAATTATAVVIGAGQTAAAAIRALRKAGFNGAIDLVGDEPHLPYERPPLSKDMLLGRGNLDACTRLSRIDAEALGVRLHLGQRAIAIDPARKQVVLAQDQSSSLRRIADRDRGARAPSRYPRFGSARRAPSAHHRGRRCDRSRVGVRDACGHCWRRLYRAGTRLGGDFAEMWPSRCSNASPKS